MSVIVAKRNKSPVQYIDDARKIADIITDRMEQFLNKLSKKYNKFKYIANRTYSYYYESPIKYACEAYIAVCYANRVYIKNKDSIEKRKKQLEIAIEYYNKLCSVLSIMFGKFNNFLKPTVISNILDLINNEVSQIQKIIQNDKNRL